jgi:hypothetical protein
MYGVRRENQKHDGEKSRDKNCSVPNRFGVKERFEMSCCDRIQRELSRNNKQSGAFC